MSTANLTAAQKGKITKARKTAERAAIENGLSEFEINQAASEAEAVAIAEIESNAPKGADESGPNGSESMSENLRTTLGSIVSEFETGAATAGIGFNRALYATVWPAVIESQSVKPFEEIVKIFNLRIAETPRHSSANSALRAALAEFLKFTSHAFGWGEGSERIDGRNVKFIDFTNYCGYVMTTREGEDDGGLFPAESYTPIGMNLADKNAPAFDSSIQSITSEARQSYVESTLAADERLDWNDEDSESIRVFPAIGGKPPKLRKLTAHESAIKAALDAERNLESLPSETDSRVREMAEELAESTLEAARNFTETPKPQKTNDESFKPTPMGRSAAVAKMRENAARRSA